MADDRGVLTAPDDHCDMPARRGIGRRLVTETLRRIDPTSTPFVRATIGPDNRASLGLVRALGASTRFYDGLIIADLPLAPATR